MEDWIELDVKDLPAMLNLRLTAPEANLTAALRLLQTDPASLRWISVDWKFDGPLVQVERLAAHRARADVSLTLCIWLGAVDVPVPIAQKTYRTFRETFEEVGDAALDVLAGAAALQLLAKDTGPVHTDWVANLLMVPRRAVEQEFGVLVDARLVEAAEGTGWQICRDPPRRGAEGVETYMTSLGPYQVLVQDGMHEPRRLEGWGLHLLRRTSERMRAAAPQLEAGPFADAFFSFTPQGPDFDYASSPAIFSGRTGSGPLYIAWDTNLLIDYFDHGTEVWKGAALPANLEERTYLMLEGLELLLALSVVRDIRFVVLPEVLDDYKKELTADRRLNRLRALDRFEAAIRLVNSGETGLGTIPRDGLPEVSSAALDEALKHVPNGGDRRLVRAAVDARVHVFLTKDDRVLKAQSHLAPFGLHITDTQELLEELVASGAHHCLLKPNPMAYWPLPDQQRIAHLIEALPSSEL